MTKRTIIIDYNSYYSHIVLYVLIIGYCSHIVLYICTKALAKGVTGLSVGFIAGSSSLCIAVCSPIFGYFVSCSI